MGRSRVGSEIERDICWLCMSVVVEADIPNNQGKNNQTAWH